MIRDALLIATAAQEAESLRQLRSPAQDVQEFGQVLAAPEIGGYRVTARVDQTARQLAETLHAFFADRRPDDTLVLYFSGHGIKDAAGELFLAATDTRIEDLEHTALSTDTLNRWIRACRSRRVLLILDCCYSGAFPRGMFAKAGGTVDVQERFTGRGMAIMTASTAVEYAFEGGELTDHSRDEARSRLAALRAEDTRTGTIDDEGGLPHDGYGVNHGEGTSVSRLRCGNVVVSASIEQVHDSGFDVNAMTTLAETAAGQIAAATPGVC